MCMIGAVKNFSTGYRYFFKNLDQVEEFDYINERFVQGEQYRYLKLPTGFSADSMGVWAGVNEAGLVVLGADANCLEHYSGPQYAQINEPLSVYEEILSQCGDVWKAKQAFIKKYYHRRIGGNGDIIIIGDRSEAIAMEYSLNRWGIQIQDDQPFIIRSNHFTLLDKLRPAPEENPVNMSSAIRYKDSWDHFAKRGKNNRLSDIFDLVRNHNHGLDTRSVCRHGKTGEYSTYCSLVIELTDAGINVFIAMNNQPCQMEFKKIMF